MLDDSGTPIIKLLVYGRGTGAAFEPAGGMLSLTTSMQFTVEEEREVRAALLNYVGRERLSASVAAGDLAAISWVDGSVTVAVAADLQLTGRPSLFGANQCAFSENLDAKRVGRLLDAWSQGLPDASIKYVLSDKRDR